MSDLSQIYLEALTHYHQALHYTRLDYLKLMKNNLTTSDELAQIWDANFVLRYMIASNKKYMDYIKGLNALNNLNLDGKMQAHLNSIYKKIGKSAGKDINTFIADGQQLLTSKEFKSFLSTSADTNEKKSAFIVPGTIPFFSISLLMIVGMGVVLSLYPFTPIVIAALWIPFLIGLVTLSLGLSTGLNSQARHQALVNGQRKFSNLALDLGPEFECTDSYTYNDGNNASVTKTQEHKKEKIGDLKSKFFQSPGSQSALTTYSMFNVSISENVTKNHNLLVEHELTFS